MKTTNIFAITFCFGTLGFYSQAFAAPRDNGVPASEQAQWKEVNTAMTGPNWRTKTNVRTGETLSYNPATTEIRRHPVTGKAEAVIREELEDINRAAPAASQVAKKNKKIVLINGIPAEVRESSEYDTKYPFTYKPRPPKPYKDSGSVTRYPGTYLPESGDVRPTQTTWEAARQKLLQQQAESRARTEAAIIESKRKMENLRIQNQKVMDSWKKPQIPSNHPHLRPSPPVK